MSKREAALEMALRRLVNACGANAPSWDAAEALAATEEAKAILNQPHWSTRIPSEDGWYWWRDRGDTHAAVMAVIGSCAPKDREWWTKRIAAPEDTP